MQFLAYVRDVIPIAGTESVLARLANNEVWLFDGADTRKVGNVNGDKPVSYEYWGENNSVLIVCGGHLHIWNGTAIERVTSTNAPTKAEIVFSKTGRVIVTEPESDYIRYSAIGDAKK